MNKYNNIIFYKLSKTSDLKIKQISNDMKICDVDLSDIKLRIKFQVTNMVMLPGGT